MREPVPSCVQCGQPLPPMSKLTEQQLPQAEAAERNWDGRQNPDGSVTVRMCLQCQIERSEALKRH